MRCAGRQLRASVVGSGSRKQTRQKATLSICCDAAANSRRSALRRGEMSLTSELNPESPLSDAAEFRSLLSQIHKVSSGISLTLEPKLLLVQVAL